MSEAYKPSPKHEDALTVLKPFGYHAESPSGIENLRALVEELQALLKYARTNDDPLKKRK